MKNQHNHYFFTKDVISIDDKKYKNLIDTQSYTNYIRNEKHLENIFTNEIYYSSLKKLSQYEKSVFYLSIIKHKTLSEISKIMKLSKIEVITYRKKAIEHFIKNVRMYKKCVSNKAGDYNE